MTGGRCRACGHDGLHRVLDLGAVPAADHFPPVDAPVEPAETSHHLAMDLCVRCGLAQLAEDDTSKDAAAFDEGHYLQIELAAPLAGSDQPELAAQFMQFITTDAFQSVIPTTNWMYPAVMPADGLPAEFDTLVEPRNALLIPEAEVTELRAQALAEWLDALSQ